MKQIKARISSAIDVVSGVHLLQLDAPEIAAEAKPGQFIMVGCDRDTILPRPFSIHSASDGRVALLFAVVGKGTEWLAARKQGDVLDIFGPLGNGYTINEKSGNLLLIGGGMGIAPLRFLAETAAAAGKTVTVLQGARTGSLLVPINTSQKIYGKGVHPSAIQCVNATEDGTEGFKGLATQLIPHYLKGIHQVFACGPMPMYKTMAQMHVLRLYHKNHPGPAAGL
jgi:dihydroorotate dehydrogenase electron transfer subunit